MRCCLLLIASCLFCPSANAALPAEKSGNSREAIASLIACLDDADAQVRQNIAMAIANLGDEAVPDLIAALSHRKPERRIGAATALATIRPGATTALPALLDAMKDKDEGVRRAVSYALSRITSRKLVVRDLTPALPPLEPVPTGDGEPR